MSLELIIESNGKAQMPLVTDGVTLTTARKGSPGKLTFTVVKDDEVNFTEGNVVRLTVDGAKMFYGFVFTKKRDKQQHLTVTAYDQLRYLLNKDTIIYKNKTASDVIERVAKDCMLPLGEIERTSFIIAQRNEPDKTLLDIIYNALDLELTNKKQMFILYDDFGKLTLKSLDKMEIGLIIDEETGENFDYTSTIDDQTYNRVNLVYDNEETGKLERHVVFDSNNINKWGVLQYHGTLQKGENGEIKAAALLSLYNAKTRKLKIAKAFGDTRVRAGSLVIVKLALGDVDVQNYMLVEKCVHTWNESEHFMDLTLRGGEFNG